MQEVDASSAEAFRQKFPYRAPLTEDLSLEIKECSSTDDDSRLHRTELGLNVWPVTWPDLEVTDPADPTTSPGSVAVRVLKIVNIDHFLHPAQLHPPAYRPPTQANPSFQHMDPPYPPN